MAFSLFFRNPVVLKYRMSRNLHSRVSIQCQACSRRRSLIECPVKYAGLGTKEP